jgi:hypothetical protein
MTNWQRQRLNYELAQLLEAFLLEYNWRHPKQVEHIELKYVLKEEKW